MKVTVEEIKTLDIYNRLGSVGQKIMIQTHYVKWLNNMMKLCESHGIDFVNNLSHMNDSKRKLVKELFDRRKTPTLF